MVGPGLPSADDMTYLRKIRKPKVEKRRRERMNASINTLKTLIGQTIKENTSPLTRVDKADVLDLTVLHLRNQPSAVAAGSGNAAAYDAGYQSCVMEATNFLSAHRLLNDHAMNNLAIHLQGSLVHHGGAAGVMGHQSQPDAPYPHAVSTPVRDVHPGNVAFTPYQPYPHAVHAMSTPVKDVHPGTVPFTPYTHSAFSPIPYPANVPDMRPSCPIGYPHGMVPFCQTPANVTSSSSTSTDSSSDVGLSSFSLSSSSSSDAVNQTNSSCDAVNRTNSLCDAVNQPNTSNDAVNKPNTSNDAVNKPNTPNDAVNQGNSSCDAEDQQNSSDDAGNQHDSSSDSRSQPKHDQDKSSDEDDVDVDVVGVDVAASPEQQREPDEEAVQRDSWRPW